MLKKCLLLLVFSLLSIQAGFAKTALKCDVSPLADGATSYLSIPLTSLEMPVDTLLRGKTHRTFGNECQLLIEEVNGSYKFTVSNGEQTFSFREGSNRTSYGDLGMVVGGQHNPRSGLITEESPYIIVVADECAMADSQTFKPVYYTVQIENSNHYLPIEPKEAFHCYLNK